MERLIRRTPSTRHHKLLERLEQRRQLPMVLAPDFVHGDFVLEHAYHHHHALDSHAFVVIDEQGVGVGFFEDYFLSLHTHELEGAQVFLSRLFATHTSINTITVLDLRASHDEVPCFDLPVTLHAHVSRAQLYTLEQNLYHVFREGAAIEERVAMHQNDVLSLIAITSRAHSSLTIQAA